MMRVYPNRILCVCAFIYSPQELMGTRLHQSLVQVDSNTELGPEAAHQQVIYTHECVNAGMSVSCFLRESVCNIIHKHICDIFKRDFQGDDLHTRFHCSSFELQIHLSDFAKVTKNKTNHSTSNLLDFLVARFTTLRVLITGLTTSSITLG
jgi:hypothetical protein